ncbi:hypothetical protein BUH_6918 [Burkholderia pseudomallei Pakistan 9]|nr:hypothetical protein BUH_6918 [Burkholderia pseudomallei Pakistan 9]
MRRIRAARNCLRAVCYLPATVGFINCARVRRKMQERKRFRHPGSPHMRASARPPAAQTAGDACRTGICRRHAARVAVAIGRARGRRETAPAARSGPRFDRLVGGR